MKSIILTLILALFCTFLFSQSRKTIKEKAIKTKTEWQYSYKYGKETKYKEAVEKYDSEGNKVEEKTFDEFGKITKHIKSEYNDKHDLIKETIYTPAGKVDKSIVYSYSDTEEKELHYNSLGKLDKTVVYKITDDLRVEKKVFDAANNLKSKKIYEYTK